MTAMNVLLRVFILLVVVPATFYFIYWVPFSLIDLPEGLQWTANLVSLSCAVGLGWFVWSKSASLSGKWISFALYGAVVVGSAGFVVGFFGPMLFAPGANQGPLLGLFITGPLGFFLGGVGGFVYWFVRRKRSMSERY